MQNLRGKNVTVMQSGWHRDFNTQVQVVILIDVLYEKSLINVTDFFSQYKFIAASRHHQDV